MAAGPSRCPGCSTLKCRGPDVSAAMLDLILDSGAFTAWSRGTPVDLDEYIAYAKANAEGVNHVVALDVIPGEFGRKPSAAEVEVSAAQGWENLLKMQAEGVDAVPVFHQGEQFRWLHQYIAHGCKYIGISPANDRSTGEKRLWLDRVFSEIVDPEGWPVIKTHAFGVTAIPLLLRYPWYSADSATWVLTSARGRILVPKVGRDGSFDYSVAPQVVCVSVESNSKGNASHWDNLTPANVAQVLAWIEFCGSTFEGVSVSYKERARCCAWFFVQFGKYKVDRPWKGAKNHFFKDL